MEKEPNIGYVLEGLDRILKPSIDLDKYAQAILDDMRDNYENYGIYEAEIPARLTILGQPHVVRF